MEIEKKLNYSLIERYAKACDASLYNYLPEAVFYANDVNDIKQVIEYAQLNRKNLTFRAAGTSLSGQTVSNGIIVDISRAWKKFEVLENGKFIKSEVGVTGSKLNSELSKYQKRFGPDPASINSAMIGGILANNSSGMSSGIERNPYNAMESIHFILSNGNEYDTSIKNDYDKFLLKDKSIADELLKIKNEINSNPLFKNKIINKYTLKNTIGYGINSFLDFEHPLDILTHLLIGSEGTLAFICDATFKTEELFSEKFTGLLLFKDVFSTCKAIDFLKGIGADALEIIDGRCLNSINNLNNIPDFIKYSNLSDYGLLFQFSERLKVEIDRKLLDVTIKCKSFENVVDFKISVDSKEQLVLWSIRKGLLTSLGASRPKGTSFILEDVAVRLRDLPYAIYDLKELLKNFNFDTGVYGHGIDGNLHFMLAEDFSKKENINKFDTFLKALSEIIVDKYDGSLKAEHGTGRNMAPFVEKEWGADLYDIMKRIKSNIDIYKVFNSNVVISDDINIHTKNIKMLPLVSNIVDKCIECGFCENVCPSRNITLTPRQRIQISRQLKSMDKKSDTYLTLNKEFQYYGIDTCAKDGVCIINCPVKINTGDLIKETMLTAHSNFDESLTNFVSNNKNSIESIIKIGIGLGTNSIINKSTNKINSICKIDLPVLNQQYKSINKITTTSLKADILYIPSCTTRLMGNSEERNLIEQHQFVANRIGLNLKIPDEIKGKCCGLAFSSKGYEKQSKVVENEFIEFIKIESNNYEIPILIDSSSCYYSILKKLNSITIFDTLGFIEKYKFHLIKEFNNIESFTFFPNCSLKINSDLENLKELITFLNSSSILVESPYCCGSAGDKSILYPELIKSSFHNLDTSIFENNCYSSNISCELGINTYLGSQLKSIIYIFKKR